ncbi:MAG: flippase-like domain-containing protein [Dorea sp.]|nr:flippase-like domain-containing protein [Dorea sp.]
MNTNLSVEKILRYAVIFLIFISVVFFLLLRGTDIRTVGEALAQTSVPFLAAGVLLAEVFHLAEGINIRILLTSFGYPVTFWQGMKYAYIGFFFSSITPSSTGGQPAQLYAMKKDGIELAHGTLALIAELASFEIAVFFMEILAVAAWIQGNVKPSGELLVLAALGFLMNILFIAGLLSVLFSYRLKERILRILHRLIERFPVGNKKRWEDKIDGAFHDFQTCADLIRREPKVMGKVAAVSICQVICWFSVPYMVYLAMGEYGAGYPQIYLLQTVLYMTAALLPFPGAAGISEYAFVKLFSGVYTGHPIAAVTLVNRGISFYGMLLISAVMMIFLWKYKSNKSGCRNLS